MLLPVGCCGYIASYVGLGDIVTIAGVNAFVADTICNPEIVKALPVPTLDPPTISMSFSVNDSPLGGKDGKFLTASHICDRLVKECEVRFFHSMKHASNVECVARIMLLYPSRNEKIPMRMMYMDVVNCNWPFLLKK